MVNLLEEIKSHASKRKTPVDTPSDYIKILEAYANDEITLAQVAMAIIGTRTQASSMALKMLKWFREGVREGKIKLNG